MSIYWRLGFPGWRMAATVGFPIKIRVEVCRDEEAGVYYATSKHIGLAVESETLDGLFLEIKDAVPLLLSVAHAPVRSPRTDIRIRSFFAAQA